MLPLACFTAAVATDVMYWQTSVIQWANFSAWLLAVGMALGVLDILFAAIARFSTPPPLRGNFVAGFVECVALAVALGNNFVHSRDGWTSVVPTGLALSIATLVLLVIARALYARSAVLVRAGKEL